MANKKINQLVAKTTIQSTDLFPIGDATTGTLYKKTIADLQAAIGGAVISVNGLVGTVVLDADDILETASPTNRYFTEARARAAISLTTSGSSGASTYSSSTGVLNVPTYTLAGLGGITATFLSGGTGITYNSGTGVISYSGTVYTDSSIRGLVSAGTGLSYNSSTGVFSISGTIYTDSSIRALFSGTSPITYNSTTGAIGITGANLTESTSSVLTITGGTGALLSAASIQVKQASGSQSGFLSSTDWTTFNNKLATITLTTTGTSGAATYSSGTLNIPQYQAVLTNPVTGTGTSGYIAKWASSSAIGSSIIYDTGSFIGINKTSAISNEKLGVKGSTNIWGVVRIENDVNQSDLNHGSLNIVNTRSTYALGNDASIMFSAFNSTSSMQPRASIGMKVASDLGGDLVFNTRNDSASGERMRITSLGRVGIGTSNPAAVFEIQGGSVGNFNLRSQSTNDVFMFFTESGVADRFLLGSSGGSGDLVFRSSSYSLSTGVERVRFTSGGNILLGTSTDNGERLYVSGSIRATGTITANSDITLKKNLAKIENALEKVEQINGYTYEFKADDSKRHAGVIAQEIQGVLPEIVNKGNDGLLGVEYGNISALLIEAIKEQQKKIQELEVKLIALGQ